MRPSPVLDDGHERRQEDWACTLRGRTARAEQRVGGGLRHMSPEPCLLGTTSWAPQCLIYWRTWKQLIRLVIILTWVCLAIFWLFGEQQPVHIKSNIARKTESMPATSMDRRVANLSNSPTVFQSDSAHIASVDPTFISPEELQTIEKALEWPAPPTSMIAAHQATSPYTSSYSLQNLHKSYSVGDVITAIITARDGLKNSKVYGGDFFQAKLFNAELKASVYGEVVDHHNGTYTATFKLLWEGQASVSIRLIHSSEAVQVLLRHRERDPDKVFFVGVFRGVDHQEKVVCNAQRSERLLKASQCCCEYKHPTTGELWFCRRPSHLPCSAWVDHGMGGYQAQLSKLDSTLLHRNYTNKYLPGDITVSVSHRDQNSSKSLHKKTPKLRIVKCVPGLDTPSPVGFYLHDNWTSLMCHAQSFPTANQIARCLKDKQVLMMGDSTLRQWFEYLLKTVPTLKKLNLYTSAQSGPLEAVDTGNNIRLVWRAHGLPIRTFMIPRADLHYIASEVDALAGGQHSVVVFTIWAHFTTFPLATYLKRLAGIRRSVLALLQRAPQTLVLIKSANMGYKDIYGSDWLSWQLDCALRMMFRELPVVIIDVWQMTSCHYSPDNIHPSQEVIQNEVDLFLSFVCPR
ncbi:NXPE family member 3-like [Colossoma macropomum]|uniref:NXPE family member 3-like n=1 Tax=Colossoma macropomum TaxID=42526 RepID=UPI0018645D83|nr:NXPE family member 3-like [Colossoma macropomum]